VATAPKRLSPYGYVPKFLIWVLIKLQILPKSSLFGTAFLCARIAVCKTDNIC